MVHLGLGAFHRAHQAWYTERAGEGGERWGIAAFTGRSPDAAVALERQDGMYTLLERGLSGDRASVISSVVEAHDGADAMAWRAAIACPRVGVLTITVTEAGYHARPDGELDASDAAIIADIAALRRGQPAATAPGRIVDGLRARRSARAGGLAVISCDNLTDNGRVTRAVVLGIARAVDEELAHWVEHDVSFVSTMVDRITPATTEDDRDVARRLIGASDAIPVVAEPFSEWVLAGEFPAGRPAWESAGARFVEDVEPYERRKLWLLNAAHSLLAYRGLLGGHETVAEAMADAPIAAEVESLWTEACAVLPFEREGLEAAVAALRERLANPRIRHTLAQVSRDGSHKLPPRVIDPLRERLAAGLPPGSAEAGTIAAWGACLLRLGPTDAASTELASSLGSAGTQRDRAELLLGALAPDLAAEPAVLDLVASRCGDLLPDEPTGRP